MQILTGESPNSASKLELLELLEERQRRIERRKLWTYYPDTGPLRRELYPKHLEFFALGKDHAERLALCANRIGKTEGMGGYETALHLIGEYPQWWPGRKFKRPISAWAAGDTAQTVRDILQFKMLGAPGKHGTGLIPGDLIVKTTPRSGIPDAVETIVVKHSSGGESVLGFKSYDQRRESFQGTEKDLIWLDEEPPLSIYTECLTRTMTSNGVVLSTFTPLEGLSETVMSFLPDGSTERATIPIVTATWDDVPHLSQEAKDALLKRYPAYQRDARSKGIPQLGAGAIYPIPESEILVDPFELPAHWPRAYAMDVGWNRTAVIWGAYDRDSETWYLYSEHYRGQAEPSVHANSIRSRGEWIPGVIDPAARGRGQADGQQLLAMYRDLGLELTEADNGVEAGIYAVHERLSAGKIKVFRTLQSWLSEFRLYRRDEKGRIVKANDHLMDATRYLVASGQQVSITKPQPKASTFDAGAWVG